MNYIKSIYLLLFLSISCVSVVGQEHYLEKENLQYKPLINNEIYNTDDLFEAKKLKFNEEYIDDLNAYNYIINGYYQHYKMIKQSTKFNYFIFNSECNDYLNKLIQGIATKNKINKKFQTFLIQTSEINAYSFGDQLLGVTTGLLASINSEQELISVLCHEMAHDLLNHVEIEFKHQAKLHTSDTIENDINAILEDNLYSNTRMEEYLADIYSESMRKNSKHELEADSLGLILLNRCGIKVESAIKSLLSIELNAINDSNLSMINYLQKNKVMVNDYWKYKGDKSRLSDIKYEANSFFDTLKTHPLTKERITLLKQYKTETLPDVIELSDSFNYIKKKSIVHCIVSSSIQNQIHYSIYFSLLLKTMDTSQKFSDQMILINVSKGIFLKKRLSLFKHIGTTDDDNPHHINIIIHFLERLKESESTTVICPLFNQINQSNIGNIYSATCTLFTAYFCFNKSNYNDYINDYKNLYYNSLFENDLLYLPKKKLK